MKKAFLAAVLIITLLGMGCSTAVKPTPMPVTSTSTPTTEATPAFIPPEVAGEVVYIPFPEKITVDGKLEDWKNIPSYTVTTGSKLSKDQAEDGSFTFAVAADADHFYITMKAVDKSIIAGKHGTDFWNEDSLEFYLNISGDLNTTKYQKGIFQLNINAADIGNTDPKALKVTGVFAMDIQVTGFVFKTDNGWGFEASVPLKGLIEVTHGKEIGFQVQMNGASLKDRDVKLIWSKLDTADQSWTNPRLFGRAIFFELGHTDVPQAIPLQALPTPTPTPTPEVIPPMINVNQIGYFPNGPKVALFNLKIDQPQKWSLLDANGKVVLSGMTEVMGSDFNSGDYLQKIDFSAYKTAGKGFTLTSGEIKSVPFKISNNIYTELAKDAMSYFYDNRSGIAIDAKYAGEQWTRPAGHLSDNNVTCWKGTDAGGVAREGCDYTLDAAGGWYDAGDFGKYVVNGGISAWTLLNAYEMNPNAFPDGSLSIPENTNGVPDILDEARWEMEFLLKMQVPHGQPLAGMAHHKLHDEVWAPIPMVPPTEVENDLTNADPKVGRYLFPPSTAATLNLAATGAVCGRIWKTIDAAFTDKCLKAAETAWAAAVANPEIYAGNTPGVGGGNYEDGNVKDEFYWAAAELFITTGKDVYLQYLLNSPYFGYINTFDWGNTAPLGTISLVTVENNLPEDKIAILKSKITEYADGIIDWQAKDGYMVPIKGMYPWGSNGTILNSMMLTGVAYRLTGDVKYLDSMRTSMDYILGRNPLNFSYVSGYGTYSMQHPHHRFWANDPANGFPPPPPGAVSGGPNANPNDPPALDANLSSLPMERRYLDVLGSFTTNEVAINWNAPLVWNAAFLNANK